MNAEGRASAERLPLRTVRVLELADLAAGPFCGKLLADLGAQVTKLEPPGGDTARQRGPFPGPYPDPETSGLFLFLNTNKRSAVLDPKDPAAPAQIQMWLSSADVLITDWTPEQLAALGLSWSSLAADYPRLVIASITPFGLDGPGAGRPAHALNLWHSGGEGFLTPGGRALQQFPDRAPVQVGGYIPHYDAGLTAALGVLAALIGRIKSGRGQLVEVSGQEVELGLNRVTMERWPNEGTLVDRSMRAYDWGGCTPCKDGYVIMRASQDHQWERFLEAAPAQALHDERFKTQEGRRAHGAEIDRLLAEWTADKTRQELYHPVAQAGCPAGFFATVEDVLESPQMRARGFFADVTHPKAGTAPYPLLPFQLDTKPWPAPAPAPLLGEATSELPSAPDPVATSDAPTADPRSLPLAGIRVLEFSWYAAGPYAAMLLGLLGADVIKVESRRRPDAFRMGVYFRPPGLDESTTFHGLNVNKRSLAMDLSKPKGRELIRQLAEQCDVILDNYRPGVMKRLGLGYEDLSTSRSDVIVASEGAGGSYGPEHEYPGFASIFSAISGIGYISGYPDGPPIEVKESNDLRVGTMFALGILAALWRRETTGCGAFVDVSARETLSYLIGDAFVGYGLTGQIPERLGNEDVLMAPHGVYQCRGNDQWVSIAAGSEAEWQALCQAIGRTDWLTDPSLRTPEGRRARRADLNAAISAWTSSQDRDEAARVLQTAGVPAFAAYSNRDAFEDEHLRARGIWHPVEHPRMGTVWTIGPPFTLHGSPIGINRSAPLLGQHTGEILAELAGLNDAAVARLDASGVLT